MMNLNETNSNEVTTNEVTTNEMNSNEVNLNEEKTSNDATPNEATSSEEPLNETAANTETTNEATSNEPNSSEATSNETTANAVTSNEETSNEATSSESTSNEATSSEMTSNESNTNENTSNEETSNETTSNEELSNKRNFNLKEFIIKCLTIKKSKAKKIISGELILLLLLIVTAAGIYITQPKVQMRVMTSYLMHNLKAYNWTGLHMDDPVSPALKEALGEKQEKSVEGLYDYLKDSASNMTWKTKKSDPEGLTTTLEVRYVDGSNFAKAYGAQMGDYAVKSIDDGSMELKDLKNVLNIISDEDNSALIDAARAEVSDQKLNYATTNLTIEFKKIGPFYIPKGVSDDAKKIASANLSGGKSDIKKMVASGIIPKIVDKVFYSVQTFDEDALAAYTGKSISDMMGISEDHMLYDAVYTYIKTCDSKIEYTVGEYNEEKNSIDIECTYVDSKNVIEEYAKGLSDYAIKNKKSPFQDEKVNINIFQKAAESAKEDKKEKTVTIKFDSKDYSKFKISDGAKAVFTANLSKYVESLF